MKNIIRLFAITIATAISPLTMAETATEGPGTTAPKKVAAPNGGRIIATVEPNMEFLVASDRKIRITILDKDGKATPATDQSASAVCGDRMNPTNLAFSVKDGVLVSDKPLPEGQSNPIILKVKTAKDPAYKTIKFLVNLGKCGSCDHPEYACTCGCEEH